ncbi:MAG: hypothetical protein KGI50_00455 [Patescibacteria group bacterium]|nr:hypothetical protein [Patescibacteria group bacterium]MDE2438173.1 hypothetical protein [Patescibacteria group bacterium]
MKYEESTPSSGMKIEDALVTIRSKRSSIHLGDSQLKALEKFAMVIQKRARSD